MATLTFNETTYEFNLKSFKETNDDIILKTGVVIINGNAEYYLDYSYNPMLDDSMALYEIYDVNDIKEPLFRQYYYQGFPLSIVSSMVQKIIGK